jgi:hypothetical protein
MNECGAYFSDFLFVSIVSIVSILFYGLPPALEGTKDQLVRTAQVTLKTHLVCSVSSQSIYSFNLKGHKCLPRPGC